MIPKLPKDVLVEVRARSALPTIAAVTYVFTGFALSVWLVLQPGPMIVLGTLLAAHAMLVSLYLQHDAAHGLVLDRARANIALGYFLSWLTGAAYFRFESYQKVHLRHHRYVCDIESFSTRRFFERGSIWSRIARALERAYVPVLHFHIRALGIREVLLRGTTGDRARVVGCAVTRLAFYGSLFALSPRAAFAQLVAYVLFVHANRFVDAFQHTFEERATLAGLKAGTRDVEMARTFTLPMAGGPRSLFGLVLLYFNLHNAHHYDPLTPWYRLPRLHEHLFGTADTPGLLPPPPSASLGDLVVAYHRHRTNRLLLGQGEAKAVDGKLSFDRFYGAFTDKLGVPIEE